MSSAGRKLRCAVYLRVSTIEQGTELQRRDLLEYIERRDWILITVYEEKVTGTHTNRKMYQDMLAAARRREFDVLLTWKLDRVFRSLRDCLNGLHELTDVGVDFVSFKDAGLDMTSPSGKLLLHILGAFAEFEASLIKMRVKAGLENAKANGKILGRPKKRDDSKIRRLRSEGRSIREIAKELGLSIGAVQNTFRKRM